MQIARHAARNRSLRWTGGVRGDTLCGGGVVMCWNDRLRGCFGAVSKVFAYHPRDEGRVHRVFEAARAQGARWEDIQQEIERVLIDWECRPEHVQEQVRRAQERFDSMR